MHGVGIFDRGYKKMTDPIISAIKYSRELFTHLEEFFIRATGRSAIEFSVVLNGE